MSKNSGKTSKFEEKCSTILRFTFFFLQDPAEIKRSSDQMKIESQLCRMGVVPNENGTLNSIAYVDEFVNFCFVFSF